MIDLYTKLDEISFISGSTQTLIFDIKTGDNEPASLSAGTVAKWRMSYLGNKDIVVLEVDGVISGGVVTVNIPSALTENIDGKYIHQLIINDASGKVFIPSEGLINIVEKIKE